ncbi:MAG: hypothetical protein AAGF11_10240 [Myxococcota bacterium]
MPSSAEQRRAAPGSADLHRAARVRAFVDFAFPALRRLAPLFEGTGVG